jgi:YD repeat-containing protein
VYTFNQSGKLTQWVDPQGHQFTYAYDGMSRPITITEPLSQRYLALTYDAQSRITSVKDQTGRHVDYGYSLTTGDLITVTDVLGQSWTTSIAERLTC